MNKPGTPPSVHHETIPLSEIPKAVLAEATVIGIRNGLHSARKRSQKQRPVPEKKIKVMIVDDETSIAETSARLLGMFGYECYAVYNATDALACAESFTPDVVLSDVIMEGMNGVDLCQEIKHMLPDCRILLLSGHVPTAHTLMQDAAKRGYNFELVAKPVRPKDLVAKIENLFGGAYSPSNTQSPARLK
jgi:response regulator RpfG family c-di-GMP phosphodiesterase